MNQREFMDEVLSSNIYPDGFEELYFDFMRYQKLTLNTLQEFHRVCEKNHIRYQLAYGSLLGAIRDEGQIPWDYDIDVFVPFCDREKLVESLLKDLSPEYYFYCPDVDKKCRHYMMRLAPKGYRSEGLHVDVFYVVGAPEKEPEAFGKKCLEVFTTRYDKLVNVREECSGNIKRYLRMFYNKLRNLSCSINMLDRTYNELCTRYDIWDSKYCISFDDESANYIYETDLLWDTKLIKLPSGTFRITKNYEYVLWLIYGKYMDVPLLNDRIDELTRMYKKLKYYESK